MGKFPKIGRCYDKTIRRKSNMGKLLGRSKMAKKIGYPLWLAPKESSVQNIFWILTIAPKLGNFFYGKFLVEWQMF